MVSAMAGGRTLTYQYDNSGNRTRIVWPDGFRIDYGYDLANRMTSVYENGGPLLASYGYDTLSRRTSFGRNGDATTYAYEPDSDLASIVHGGAPGEPSFAFTRNPVHQILTAAISPASLSYSPPAAGTANYSVNGLNQYTSAGGAAHAYDAKGNLISDGIWGHAYDAENRLTATNKPGTDIAYAYDGLGRRISRTVNSVTTSYLLDGDEEVAEYDGSGALLRRYVYGPSIDDRILMYEGSGTAASNKRFYYANHQGSTREFRGRNT